jgi:2-iminobutanoate/2-iminopropanoate deaminase
VEVIQMTKEIIHTNDAPRSLAGYSQAVKAGGFIYVSGQGPFHPKTGEVVGTTIQEQTGQCLRNIGMNEEWGKWFPSDPPARQGAKLAIHPKGMKISIALIAEA